MEYSLIVALIQATNRDIQFATTFIATALLAVVVIYFTIIAIGPYYSPRLHSMFGHPRTVRTEDSPETDDVE